MEHKKRVLFMRGYFPPENAASNQMCLDLIKYLGEKDMEVVVICPLPTRGVSKEVRRTYINRRRELLYKNVTIKRYWLPKERDNTFLRVIRYLLQNIHQFIYGLCFHYDILFLYSTPPTNGFIGGLLSRIKRKPFYYYLHDIFPDSLIQTGMTHKNSILWRIGRWIENFSYLNAKKVITLSHSMKNNIVEKGLDEKKVKIIPNWVNVDNVKPIKKEDNSLIDEYGIDNKKFTVTYAGNIGEAQSVSTLIETAKILSDYDDIQFLIIGDGIEKNKCIEQAKNLNNVSFIPMQSPRRISEVYSLGDVSTVLCKKGVGTSGMPSKTASILATGTMLIAAFDDCSDLKELINTYDIGICVDPENPKELAEAIIWSKTHRKECKEKAKRGTAYLNENMTSKICTDRLYKVINS